MVIVRFEMYECKIIRFLRARRKVLIIVSLYIISTSGKCAYIVASRDRRGYVSRNKRYVKYRLRTVEVRIRTDGFVSFTGIRRPRRLVIFIRHRWRVRYRLHANTRPVRCYDRANTRLNTNNGACVWRMI